MHGHSMMNIHVISRARNAFKAYQVYASRKGQASKNTILSNKSRRQGLQRTTYAHNLRLRNLHQGL